MQTYTHKHIDTYMHTDMQRDTHIHRETHTTCTHILAHTHLHTHTHTYVCLNLYRGRLSLERLEKSQSVKAGGHEQMSGDFKFYI